MARPDGSSITLADELLITPPGGLLEDSWRRRAPKRLIAALDSSQPKD